MNNYVLGSSAQELERLTFQAKVLRPFTTRLFSEIDMSAGMNVLDIGSGAGDVSMLAAEFVGAEGSVLGIDMSQDAINLATHRAAMAGYNQIKFETFDIYDFPGERLYDCVIGRYVMVHQTDPVAFLRKAASLVKPGGVLALHEILLVDPLVDSYLMIPLWQLAGDWIVAAIKEGGSKHDAAANMLGYFIDAQLPQPFLHCERPIGGGSHSLMYRWAFEGVRSVFPQLLRMGLVATTMENLDTFESRLRTQALDTHAQLLGPTQITAWVRFDA